MEARTVASPALVVTDQSIVTEEFRFQQEREIDSVYCFLEGKVRFREFKFSHVARNYHLVWPLYLFLSLREEKEGG